MRSVAARILLVQNGDHSRRAYRLNLELAGFSVCEAGDGEQALRVARETELELIILDLALPVLDGWVVLGELKTDEALRSIPVVILTASAEETVELQARERGAIAFLAKPIAVDDLISAIHRTLADHERCR
jgi:CheY-like chemotaxis protein